MEVKFCENNFVHGTERIVEELEANYPEIDVAVEPCLGYCGDCAKGPYALVDDELVQAESADDLYEAIVERI